MKERLIKLKNAIIGFFNIGHAGISDIEERQELLDMVQQAHKDWQIALNNYNHCSDPDFIDYSIYNIDAMEKKYVYLIKRARKENIVVELSIDDSSQFAGIYQDI